MIIRTPILLAAPALVGLWACGSPKTGVISPTPVDFGRILVDAEETEAYRFEGADCQNLREADREPPGTTFRLSQWRDGMVLEHPVSIEGLAIKNAPLSSPAVHSALVGASYRRTCDASRSPPPSCVSAEDESGSWVVMTEGAPLRLCTPDSALARNSLEHVALSALTAVEKTARAIRLLTRELNDVASLSLMIMPRFESLWFPWTMGNETGVYASVVTDNLSYFPQLNGSSPLIAIFPRAKTSGQSTRLWESEFIVAHEYAHHIERALNLDRYDESRSAARLAVSEGFADVLAFASQGASSSTIDGIPCMGFDRNPTHSSFTNGQAKILDRTTIPRAEDASTSSDGFQLCQGVNPRSGHGIGAIMAYWIAQFSGFTPGYGQNAPQAIASVAIEWLRASDRQIGAGNSDEKGDLKKIATSLEFAVTRQFERDGVEINEGMANLLCQKMRLAFPLFEDHAWFGRTGC